MTNLTKILPVLALTLVVGCDASDRQADPDSTRDSVLVGADRSVTAEMHRQDVRDAMRETRARMDELENRITERSGDMWDRIAARADETWSEIESSVARVGDDDPASIHRSREDAARRLAELEAELAGAQVATAQTLEELQDVSNAWLERVESDIGEMEAFMRQPQGMPGMHRDRVELDGDDLRDVRERLRERRAELQEALTERDDFEDRREEMADHLADLVQDVREASYRFHWSHPMDARG